MSEKAIIVENLSKKYVIGHRHSSSGQKYQYTALRDVIGREFRNFARKAAALVRGRQVIQGDEIEDFWALKDVSLEVKQGEVLGIIGRNGAGKSTLLKILSRITEPTNGRVILSGRAASLLEVGTGFHPELTGRENVFLNGAVLGMTQQEIRKKFDEIVAFAEVEKFLDTPVKHFSSGMYVRLAFAVAAHLEPEILIVDEVLAVGDVQFQKKCLGKMKDVSKIGRTVLFVSHNMSALEALTNRAILLEAGALTYSGATADAISRYLSSATNTRAVRFQVQNTQRPIKDQRVSFVEFRFERRQPVFFSQEDFSFVVRIKSEIKVQNLRTSMTVFAVDGTPVGSCFGGAFADLERGQILEYKVILPNPRLAPGFYYCGVAIGVGTNTTGHIDYDIVLNTLYFEVRLEETADGVLPFWVREWGNIVMPPLEQCLLAESWEPINE